MALDSFFPPILYQPVSLNKPTRISPKALFIQEKAS